ncbi:hypothetical protein I7103_002205 [Vibrio parahaemolyticus]|nr:hypothetical protein [Vibrio parahaemolyticus]EGQ8115445.1 hypothetical protein [Vibrio parahaemolyticus]EVU10263.1 hypothetical protein D046_8397 [Vibrio parahaemolyticus V-223/04]
MELAPRSRRILLKEKNNHFAQPQPLPKKERRRSAFRSSHVDVVIKLDV